MSNSQVLDDLRYCAEAFTTDAKFQAEANLRQFAAGLIGFQISPPAQKTASVLGGSGAALVGIPSRFPCWVVVTEAGSDDESIWSDHYSFEKARYSLKQAIDSQGNGDIMKRLPDGTLTTEY